MNSVKSSSWSTLLVLGIGSPSGTGFVIGYKVGGTDGCSVMIDLDSFKKVLIWLLVPINTWIHASPTLDCLRF